MKQKPKTAVISSRKSFLLKRITESQGESSRRRFTIYHRRLQEGEEYLNIKIY